MIEADMFLIDRDLDHGGIGKGLGKPLVALLLPFDQLGDRGNGLRQGDGLLGDAGFLTLPGKI